MLFYLMEDEIIVHEMSSLRSESIETQDEYTCRPTFECRLQNQPAVSVLHFQVQWP